MTAVPWISLATSAALLTAAWLVHSRLRGFLPEDHPGPGRKRHDRPTPMAGALPAAVSVGAAAILGLGWLAAGVALAALIGLADDRAKDVGGAGVRWTVKAAALTAAAALALGDVELLDAIDVALALGFLFVVTNAVNFLDNQNGIAVALGLVALGLIGGGDPAHPATVTALCWLPFLPFNWPSARMFLGDAGAYALGLASATFALRYAITPIGVDWGAAAVPVAIPLADFTQVVVARLFLGYAPWIGDRRHLTHLVLHSGIPRWALAPLFAAVAVTIGLSLTA